MKSIHFPSASILVGSTLGIVVGVALLQSYVNAQQWSIIPDPIMMPWETIPEVVVVVDNEDPEFYKEKGFWMTSFPGQYGESERIAPPTSYAKTKDGYARYEIGKALAAQKSGDKSKGGGDEQDENVRYDFYATWRTLESVDVNGWQPTSQPRYRAGDPSSKSMVPGYGMDQNSNPQRFKNPPQGAGGLFYWEPIHLPPLKITDKFVIDVLPDANGMVFADAIIAAKSRVNDTKAKLRLAFEDRLLPKVLPGGVYHFSLRATNIGNGILKTSNIGVFAPKNVEFVQYTRASCYHFPATSGYSTSASMSCGGPQSLLLYPHTSEIWGFSIKVPSDAKCGSKLPFTANVYVGRKPLTLTMQTEVTCEEDTSPLSIERSVLPNGRVIIRVLNEGSASLKNVGLFLTHAKGTTSLPILDPACEAMNADQTRCDWTQLDAFEEVEVEIPTRGKVDCNGNPFQISVNALRGSRPVSATADVSPCGT